MICLKIETECYSYIYMYICIPYVISTPFYTRTCYHENIYVLNMLNVFFPKHPGLFSDDLVNNHKHSLE